MAIQIKETLVLEGRDAEAFLENLHSIIENSSSQVELEKKSKLLERMRANYEQLQSLVKCAY